VQTLFIFRWGFTPLEEAKRFQHDLVFSYLAKYVEDNYPKELEKMLKDQEQINQTTTDGQKDRVGK
jgi:polyhydroxyalkanoate synthesis regulator phasin